MFVKKLTLVTGGFDPIHSGHIEYFKEASKLSEFLVIGLNSDEWLINKKQQAFWGGGERREDLRLVGEGGLALERNPPEACPCSDDSLHHSAAT